MDFKFGWIAVLLLFAGWFIVQNFGSVDSQTAIERPVYTIVCGVLLLFSAPFILCLYFFRVAWHILLNGERP